MTSFNWDMLKLMGGFILVFILMTRKNYIKIKNKQNSKRCDRMQELLKEYKDLIEQEKQVKAEQVKVKITDPLLVEEVRNLYELQDIYNAQIEQLDKRICDLDTDIDAKTKELKIKQDELNAHLRTARDKSIYKKMYGTEIKLLTHTRDKLINEQLKLQEQRMGKVRKSNEITRKIQKIGRKEYENQKKAGAV